MGQIVLFRRCHGVQMVHHAIDVPRRENLTHRGRKRVAFTCLEQNVCVVRVHDVCVCVWMCVYIKNDSDLRRW